MKTTFVTLKRLVLSIALSLAAGSCLAGNQTGTVRMELGQYDSNASSAGMTFFVLEGGAKTGNPACAIYQRWVINNNWPAAKFQVAMLLAAVATGKTVTVNGTGDCGVWNGDETVVEIHLNKN